MDFIYEAIISRLKENESILTSKGLKPIKHIDLYKNQYVQPEVHLPYVKPALFYQWSAVWKDISRKVQEGDLTIRLHLELENYSRSFSGSRNMESALDIFEYQKRVNALLIGWKAHGFTALRRINTDPDENPTQTNVTVMTYTTKIVDDTALQIEEAGYIKEPLDDMVTEQVGKKQDPEPEYSGIQVM